MRPRAGQAWPRGRALRSERWRHLHERRRTRVFLERGGGEKCLIPGNLITGEYIYEVVENAIFFFFFFGEHILFYVRDFQVFSYWPGGLCE